MLVRLQICNPCTGVHTLQHPGVTISCPDFRGLDLDRLGWALRWSLYLNADQSLREFDSFGDESEASSLIRKRRPERTLDQMPAVPSGDRSSGLYFAMILSRHVSSKYCYSQAIRGLLTGHRFTFIAAQLFIGNTNKDSIFIGGLICGGTLIFGSDELRLQPSPFPRETYTLSTNATRASISSHVLSLPKLARIAPVGLPLRTPLRSPQT